MVKEEFLYNCGQAGIAEKIAERQNYVNLMNDIWKTGESLVHGAGQHRIRSRKNKGGYPKVVNQDWFELQDVRKRNFSKSVWIPLRAITHYINEGKYGYEGYKEDFFGTGSIAVSTEKLEDAKNLGWMDVGISHHHSGYVEDGKYIPADLYNDYRSELTGIHLVLEQELHDGSPNVWHLNQDLVLSLGLKREGNSWLRPMDGYNDPRNLDRGFYSAANIDELYKRRHKFTIALPTSRKWIESYLDNSPYAVAIIFLSS